MQVQTAFISQLENIITLKVGEQNHAHILKRKRLFFKGVDLVQFLVNTIKKIKAHCVVTLKCI